MRNFSGEDFIALLCCGIVIYMLIGCTLFLVREFRHNFKFLLLIFLSVIVGLVGICIYNYFKGR